MVHVNEDAGVPGAVNPFAHLTVIPQDDLAVQQLELEQGMTELGIARYRSRTEKAIASGTEEATAYGTSLLAHLTEKVAEGVREFLRDAESGRPGKRHMAVKYLRQVDARVVSYLALKGVLGSISIGRSLQAVAHVI